MRFFRIDEKVKIVEKDAEAGYLVFELTDDGKRFTGSAELIKDTDRRGRKVTRVILQIADRPAYQEQGMLDRLDRKLRDELGPPPAPPPPPSTKDSAKKKS